MALVDVIRADGLYRLKRCAGDCGGVLVDLSKNRSCRYCDRGCGNRANVAAYRARKAAESAEWTGWGQSPTALPVSPGVVSIGPAPSPQLIARHLFDDDDVLHVLECGTP